MLMQASPRGGPPSESGEGVRRGWRCPSPLREDRLPKPARERRAGAGGDAVAAGRIRSLPPRLLADEALRGARAAAACGRAPRDRAGAT